MNPFPQDRLDMRQKDAGRWVHSPGKISKKVRIVLDQANELLPENGSILDVGCGKGYAFDWLKRHRDDAFHYTGIDLHPEEIAYAKREHEGTGAEYICMDLYDLQAAQFDVVMCARVLVHLLDIHRAVEAMWRVTRRALLTCTHGVHPLAGVEPIKVAHKIEDTWAWVRIITPQQHKDIAEFIGAKLKLVDNKSSHVIGVFTHG